MAAKSQTETHVEDLGEDEEWTTVVEESGRKLSFANVGEMFVGTYVGTETINPKEGDSFDQQRFRDPEGTLFAINGGFKLREGLKDVAAGEVVRITYMGEIDTGQPSPMKDFRVDVKRGTNSPSAIKEESTEDIPF